MKRIIESYVNAGQPVAKDRVYLDTAHGGLGLIDLDKYFTCLQAAWVKQACRRRHDCWSYAIASVTKGKPELLHPSLLNANQTPLLSNIAYSWSQVTEAFYAKAENFEYAPIFYNNLIKANGSVIKFAMLEREIEAEPERTLSLQISDFYQGRLLTHEEVTRNTGIPLAPVNYMRIGSGILASVRARGRDRGPVHPGTGISQFLNRFKKGSRHFRKLFVAPIEARREKARVLVGKFYEKAEITTPNPLIEPIREWINPLLSNRQREFLFKFYNNRLPTNTRISHHVDNIDRACTFCTAQLDLPAPEESFAHLFWHCRYTAAMTEAFISEFVPEIAHKTSDEKKRFILACDPLSPAALPEAVIIAKNIFLFVLWEMKILHKTPSWQGFRIRLANCLMPILLHHKSTRIGLNRRDFFLCRHVRELRNDPPVWYRPDLRDGH